MLPAVIALDVVAALAAYWLPLGLFDIGIPSEFPWIVCICNCIICPFTAGIYVLDSTIGQTQIIVSILWFYTSSTAQGGGGSFKDRTL